MLRWIYGYVICCTVGGDWERFMNMCRHHRIVLWHIERSDKIVFSMSIKNFKHISPLAMKAGILPHILQKIGLPFIIMSIRRKASFYTGFILFLMLLHILSFFVWDISFEGQHTYTKETLTKALEDMDVHTGMRRKNLRCDDIEKNIRRIYPDISWVSAEEIGSRLVISIKEANDDKIDAREEEGAYHLVAAYDGTVKSICVNRGIAAVEVGQKVKKGQILISGIIPITNDDETVVENMTVYAKGDVCLYVKKSITEDIPVSIKEKKYTGKSITKQEIILGGRTISLKNPMKQFHKSCKYDIITTIFSKRKIQPFPYTIQRKEVQYLEYQWHTKKRTKKEIKTEGNAIYQKYMRDLKAKDCQLIDHSAKICYVDDDTWRLSVTVGFESYECIPRKIKKSEWQVKDGDEGK